MENCFAGSERLLTKEYGSVALQDVCGLTVTALTLQGWREAVVRSFGSQPTQRITFRPATMVQIDGFGSKPFARTLASTNIRHTVTATPDHRWFLAQGGQTQQLSRGDAVLAAGAQIDVESDTFLRGFRHGMVFGDGCLTWRGRNWNRFTLRLCGAKNQAYLPHFADDDVHYYPSAAPDPTVVIRSEVDFKQIPPAGLHDDYYAGFVEGWLVADGHKPRQPNTIWLTSTNDDALEWLIAHAPLAGYVVTGDRAQKPGRGAYPNAKPFRHVSLRPVDLTVWKVESVDPVGEQEVFCATVPDVGAFTLAGGIYTSNCYMNAAEGQTRFPGRKPFVSGLPGTRTYLSDWRGNLIATTDTGRVYRIDQAGNREDVTGVPISGDGRHIFTKTEDELVIAAGGFPIRLGKGQTEVLSEDAPQTTHIGFVDGYLVAIEPFSGRFFHSRPGQYRQWDPLDVFTAEGKPDDLNALAVTPYRELLLAGEDSVEQFERLSTGDVPFFRRWTTGEGIFAPYTLLAIDNGTYGINLLREFVRFSQQVTRPQSEEIVFLFERVEDWSEAWAQQIHIEGQKFIVLQIPHAENIYGTSGITALFDYKNQRWSNLYDFDEDEGRPVRWAPWSYHPLWGRHFVGVAGGVEELDTEVYDHSGETQRMLVRSGHVSQWGPSRIDNFRIRLRRGVGPQTPDPKAVIGFRVNKDNQGFGRWKYKSMGRPGKRDMVIELGPLGCADTWQVEYFVTDPVAVELVGAQAYVERLGW
jgi:hypothetical protein